MHLPPTCWYRVALVALCIALAACSRPSTPQDVTERFWRAVVAGHKTKLTRYVVERDRAALDEHAEVLPVESFELGRVVIDADTASIETQLTLDGDQKIDITISTALEREGEAWRVDYRKTVGEISMRGDLARIMDQIGTLGDRLKDGVEQSIEDMRGTLPAIEAELSRLESDIKQRMPELRENLEAFSKQIEEALKAPPTGQPDHPAPSKKAVPDGTIAL